MSTCNRVLDADVTDLAKDVETKDSQEGAESMEMDGVEEEASNGEENDGEEDEREDDEGGRAVRDSSDG